MTPDELDAAFAVIKRLLKPAGRLILGDILRPEVGMSRDVIALLRFGAKGGFLKDASFSRDAEWGLASETVNEAAKAVVAQANEASTAEQASSLFIFSSLVSQRPSPQSTRLSDPELTPRLCLAQRPQRREVPSRCLHRTLNLRKDTQDYSIRMK